MPKSWLVLFAAAMTGLLGCASQPDGTTGTTARANSSASALKAGLLEVTSAQFGVFGADSEGHRILFETDRFPAVTAAPYGWYIIFKTSKPTVVWREEFELPEAPPSWGPGEALGIYTISPDRKTAVTERVIPTRLGFIANEWRYAPGDPIGAHAMRVYIDGQLVREFKFNIEDGPGRGRSPGRSPTT
jgi:hypothetical protein